MAGFGTTDMIIIHVLVLIIFGAGKLPAMAGVLGLFLQFKRGGMRR